MLKAFVTFLVVTNFGLIRSKENNIHGDELQNFTTYFNVLLRGSLGPLDLTTSEDISLQCRTDSAEYLRQLQNLTLWALKMHDASAKIPPGILNGNLNQLGDFDQCLSAQSDDQRISGQYCLTNFKINVPNSAYLRNINNLVNSHYPFRTDIDDPRHISPRCTVISWAICVPSTCTHRDVEIALNKTLQTFMDKSGISLQIRVLEEMCQVLETSTVPVTTILAGLFFALVFGFVLVVTLIDHKYECAVNEYRGIWGILFAFSLRRTTKTVFSTESLPGDIATIHGIRFLSMCVLLVIHKLMTAYYTPFINRTDMIDQSSEQWTVFLRNASFYTDVFLMFSGMLTSYLLFARAKRGRTINFTEEYFSRLIRLLPPVVAMIIFSALIQPWLGSGPQFKSIVDHNSELCQKHWWRNILFIQNYFGAENLCLPHTHHISTDTQLFLISPLFFWILYKWQNFGVFVLVILAAISTYLRFYVTYTMGLNLYMFFGISYKILFDTANYTYIMPTHRSTVYIMGFILGYYLANMKINVQKPHSLMIGHVTAFILFCASYFGPSFMCTKTYVFEAIHGAVYTAFGPVAWCASWMWIIILEISGHQNIIVRFLSWPGWKISTRLSYAIYLTQLPIYFHLAGVQRGSEYYEFIKLLPDYKEVVSILGFSIIVTLVFDTPFETIKKMIFTKYKNVQTVKEQEEPSEKKHL